MTKDDVEAIKTKCRKLVKERDIDPKELVELVEETLEIICGIMARQNRQASNIQKVATKAGLDKKYL